MTSLRLLALAEAATFALLLIAVPLKHLFHQPQYVAILGPIHGIVFTIYALGVVSADQNSLGDQVRWRYLALAFIPFGGVIAAMRLARNVARSAP